MPTDVVLRLASAEELPAVAELYLEIRAAAVPQMPPIARLPDEVRGHIASWDLTRRQVWVAEVGHDAQRAIRGFASVEPRWLSGLYVGPELAGQGVGGSLLELVKQLQPGGFGLWVFESNTPARALYRKHGLVELEHTDGSLSDEKQPDLKMAWLGHSPRAFLDQLMAEVDRDQADLDARRAALRAVLADLG
ncbi:GNAT family N-acetyltransferase [Nocardioides sp.]|uniref:GNAT family N-acetyltransferase n=1 Tax=Nocardioides sp. TaxID=35761 RepID=UPI0039E48A44